MSEHVIAKIHPNHPGGRGVATIELSALIADEVEGFGWRFQLTDKERQEIVRALYQRGDLPGLENPVGE